MSRSRGLNRFSRLVAKRRRSALRSEIPSFRASLKETTVTINNSHKLREKALREEALIELVEPS